MALYGTYSLVKIFKDYVILNNKLRLAQAGNVADVLVTNYFTKNT